MPEINFVTRITDNGKVVNELQKVDDAIDHLGRTGPQSAKKMDDAFKSAGAGISSSATSIKNAFMGMVAAIGATQLVSTLLSIGKASITMAMDAVESENLFAVSMGSMANKAAAWSLELNRTLGLNQYEVRKSVGTFNVMFSAMGIGSEKAFEMSKGLTQLAYDFSSFYNLKPEEAFAKIRSGISGEIEPLKVLGIVMDEATVKSFAYTSGIAKLGTELTQQEKVLARYGLLLEQTSLAQGDLARTIDSPANQLRLLQTRMEELQTNIGMAFLPALSTLTGELTNLADGAQVGASGLQYLAKVLAAPIMGYLTLGRAIAEVKLSIAEMFVWLDKKIPNPFPGQAVEHAKDMRDAAASVLEYNDKIAKLEKSVDSLGKFNYAAAKATQAVEKADLSAMDAAAKHAKEVKKLTDEYEKHSKPATVLIDHLEEMVTATRPLDKLIAEYATEIVNAARKQTDLGVSLTNSEKYIVDQATAITTLQDGVEGVTVTVSAFAQELDRLSSLSGPKDELINLGKQMDEDKQKADALADAIIALMPKNTFLADETDKVAAAMKQNNEYMAEAKEKAEALGKALASELGGAVDDLSSNLAKNLIDWGGWKDTIIGFGKTIAESLLTSFLDGFLSPLKSALSSVGKSIGNLLTGAGATSGGGLLGGLLGLGASTGTALATTSTLTAATGVPSIMGTIFASSGGLAAVGGTAALAGGGAAAGTGAAAAGTGAAAGSGGLLGSIGAFATNPITIAVAAAAALSYAGYKLADWISGPNSWEAGSEEVARDFGGVEIAADSIKAIAEGIGISESQAWGIRKDLLSSPQALQAMYALAEDQGKTAAFLTSLEKIQTSWGDFNFRDAFELGSSTGDWTELNNQFVAAFGNSEKLNEVMPDWKELLLGESSYVSETDLVIEALTTLRDTLQESLPAVQSMYDIFLATGEVTDEFAAQITALGGDVEEFRGFADSMTALTAQAAAITAQTASWESLRDSFVTLTDAGRDMYDIFLETGEITDELADEITSLGGDLSAFESYSRLSAINSSWEELIAHFEETGEILPGLRQMFIDFGGDLSALDAASALEGLTDSLTFIDSLISQLESNLPDPIEQLLAGNMDADTIAALTAAGLDPNQFKGLVSSGAALTQWDKANYQPFQDLTPELESYLKEYGGAAGSTAVSRYYAGQNTITQGLLDTTRLGIEKEYQDEVKTLLEYLGTVQESTTTAIETLTASVETQFDIVGGNIQDALDLAAEDVVTEIDLMIAALGTQSDAIVTAMNAVSQGLIDALDEIITRNTTELVSVLTPTTEPDTYVPSGGGNSTPGDNYGEDGSNYPNPNSYAPSLALGRSVARTGLSAEEGKGGGGVEINIDMRNSRVESPAQFVQEVTAGLKSYFGHGGSLAMLNAR
jgi:hypothetical protein